MGTGATTGRRRTTPTRRTEQLAAAIDPSTCDVQDLVEELRFIAFWCGEGRPGTGTPEAQAVRTLLEAAARRLATVAERPVHVVAAPVAESRALVQHARSQGEATVARAVQEAALRRVEAEAAVRTVLAGLDELAGAQQALRAAVHRLGPVPGTSPS